MTNRQIVSSVLMACSIAVLAGVLYDVGGRLMEYPYAGDGGERQVATKGGAGLESRGFDYDIARIVDAHLFGKAHKPSEVKEVAPKTRLRVTLKGVISSDNPRMVRALISVNASPVKGYGVGDRITGTDALLHSARDTAVLLDRNGDLESLTMSRPDLLASGGNRT